MKKVFAMVALAALLVVGIGASAHHAALQDPYDPLAVHQVALQDPYDPLHTSL